MRQIALLFLITALASCTQSGQVFEPTNNRSADATATVATYTFTLNINLTAQGANHQGKPFSALLFKDGVLFAAQHNSGGAAATDGVGAATLVLNGLLPNNCPDTTPAALEAGTYALYFAIQYGAETVTTINPNAACGANGWIQSSAAGNNLYGIKGSVNVTGNTTYNINDLNLTQFRQHTFNLTAGFGQYACYIGDVNTSAYTATMQPLAIYSRAANGTTTGGAAAINLLPVGTYKYFCSGGADTTHFQAGSDSAATGTFTVTNTGTTTLNAAAFTAL